MTKTIPSIDNPHPTITEELSAIPTEEDSNDNYISPTITDTPTPNSSDNTVKNERSYGNWTEALSVICKTQHANWATSRSTGQYGGLYGVRSGDGYMPLPNDSRATEFDAAVANLQSTMQKFGSIEAKGNINEMNAATPEKDAAIDRARAAVRAVGDPDCVALVE